MATDLEVEKVVVVFGRVALKEEREVGHVVVPLFLDECLVLPPFVGSCHELDADTGAQFCKVVSDLGSLGVSFRMETAISKS